MFEEDKDAGDDVQTTQKLTAAREVPAIPEPIVAESRATAPDGVQPQVAVRSALSEREALLPEIVRPKPVMKSAPEQTEAQVAKSTEKPVAKSTPKKKSHPLSERSIANARILQERCRQICLSLFFREYQPIKSLGFTSSISGEGKSFLSTVTALVLANDSHEPVSLIECNWENPTLHTYFGCPATPGLAEWLRGECSESEIRHQVNHNLTLIPAGDGGADAVQLLQAVRHVGLSSLPICRNDLLVMDLPAVATTAYGALAASLVESLIVVVRAGVTPDGLVAETCNQLKDLSVHGLILNQLESNVPRWIRQLL